MDLCMHRADLHSETITKYNERFNKGKLLINLGMHCKIFINHEQDVTANRDTKVSHDQIISETCCPV